MKRTPLYDLHLSQGAQMVEFAGYEMPLRYPLGVLQEHLHVREKAGLFDVAHMGLIQITGKSVLEVLETLTPTRLSDLPVNQSRYTVLTNKTGGIRDDLIVTHKEDYVEIVVNAGTKEEDLAYLTKNLPDLTFTPCFDSHALMALQGPKAADVLSDHTNIDDLYFMDGKPAALQGIECWVSRSGYTGEDGVEITCPAAAAAALAKALLAHNDVEMIGLGARDSLRLEAGLSLYGHDLTPDITPMEAGLGFIITKDHTGYPGHKIILDQKQNGAPRTRIGLLPEGRAPVREGAALFNKNADPIGTVTSGGFCPSLKKPIALGLIDGGLIDGGLIDGGLIDGGLIDGGLIDGGLVTGAPAKILADLRGRKIPCEITPLPFRPSTYRRKSI